MAITTYHNNIVIDMLIDMVKASVAEGKAGDLGAATIAHALYANKLKYDNPTKTWLAFQFDNQNRGLHWTRCTGEEVLVTVMERLSQVYQAGAEDIFGELKAMEEGPQPEGEEAKVAFMAKLAAMKGQLDRVQKEVGDQKDVPKAQRVLVALAGMAGMSTGSIKDASPWDANPWILGTPNGVIELLKDAPVRFRPGKPDDYVTKVVNADWTDVDVTSLNEGNCEFIRFMKDLYVENQDEIYDYVMRVFGYSITGVVYEKRLNVFHGPQGNNGKTTQMELIGDILGPYAYSAPANLLIKTDRDKGDNNESLANLQGRRLVWVSETGELDRLNEDQAKKISGGDSITTCRKYEQQRTFKPTFHPILITNNLPRVDPEDQAIWNRLTVVQYGRSFVSAPTKPNERLVDMGLKDRILKNERNEVLALLVHYCLEWQRRGLDVPQCLVEATTLYREGEDWSKRFAEDCLVEGETLACPAGEAYDVFRKWITDEQGFKNPITNPKFRKKMEKRYECKRRNQGWFYIGFTLRDRTVVEDDMVLANRAMSCARQDDYTAALKILERVGNQSTKDNVTAIITALRDAIANQPVQLEMGNQIDSTGLYARLRAASR